MYRQAGVCTELKGRILRNRKIYVIKFFHVEAKKKLFFNNKIFIIFESSVNVTLFPDDVLTLFIYLLFINLFMLIAEGAFKKLKPEPNSGGISSVSGSGISSPGSGISSLPHAGHTPTTVSCPTPARRRHRTTFTQVFKYKTLCYA